MTRPNLTGSNMTKPNMTKTGGDSRAGLVYAVLAYVAWGVLPLYVKAVDHVPAAEVVAHRVLWSVPVPERCCG